MTGEAVLRDGPGGRWLVFRTPRRLLVAHRPEEVMGRLADAAAAVEEQGLWAVGYVAYESAPGLDAALAAHPPGELPLLWLGLYQDPEIHEALPPAAGAYRTGPWQPSISRRKFGRAFDRIQRHLAHGDSYQVNYTFRLRSSFEGDPWALFLDLARAQEAPHAAFLDLGDWAVASASPELFFRLDGETVTSRPMKGTAPRGRTLEEDATRARELAASAKERAENVMVVDMLRNDLGRVARPGTVRVEELFTVERYPTVLQMTSTVTAKTLATLPELFAALFPCASVTGAPKVRTTEILRALEPDPRGVYTGAVGYLAPGRRASWNVAIRTAVVDRARGRVEYGVGGGIVADSRPDAEYEEARLKARVLAAPRPELELLESLRWSPGEGYLLLAEHLRRLAESAEYFGFPWAPESVEAELLAHAEALPSEPHKVRLLLDRRGGLRLEAEPLGDGGFLELGSAAAAPSRRLALAAGPVDSSDLFLYHKTTRREVYEAALAARPEADDVLLWNERSELTETTRANLVVRIEGELRTPPVGSGLLAGTYRERLLRRGEIREAVVRLDDLPRCQELLLINSVRGCRRAELIGVAETRAVGTA